MMFDVAVIGAGPAGAVAARVAARSGSSVCVLERAEVPRYKTCGGGIVGLSADNAGIDLCPLTRAEIDRLTVTWDGALSFTRRSRDQPLLSMIMRSDFDAALLTAARDAGAEVRTGTLVTGLTEEPDGVTITVRGGPAVRARVVVGADGTSGKTGTYVGVTLEQVDLGLEGEFQVDAAMAAVWAGRVLLDWGPVPGSYGWVFPKGDVLTVGVIGAKEQADGLRAYYRSFVERLGLRDAPRIHDSGHLTRVRIPDSPLRRGRVLVAGDAAGLLDPWTREGISFALRSGRLAGDAASCAASGDLAALDRYPRQVTDVLGPEMAAGREVLALFQRHPGVLHAFLAVVPGGFGLFGRIVAGRSTVARQLRRPGMRPVVAALSR